MTWSSRQDAYRGALDAVERILNRGGDADEVLRAVVEVLSRLYRYAAIAFVEGEDLVVGPSCGEPGPEVERIPVSFQGTRVAELRISPPADDPQGGAFLERVATLISAHCLVGWDTPFRRRG